MMRVRPIDSTFPVQRAFIEDPSPFKASFCTRRAAKSYSVGIEYVEDAERFPRAHYLFLMTVRAQAKRDFWEDVLKDIDRRCSLGIRFNESELVAHLPNGAQIYVGGADSNEHEWRKLIAGKYRKVHIDEAQGFVHADLRNLVYEAFKPAVADYRGSIGMSGTPGLVNHGLFFDVTTGKEPGWSVHRWKTSDNPYMAEKIAAEIAELKALRPGVDETPWFRRNYLGEWVIETEALVYRWSEERNTFQDLPSSPRLDDAWHYVLGVDLGFEDATSFVVCAYNDHLPTLFMLEATKEPGLDITATARRIRALVKRYGFDRIIIDGANKQAVEEMRNRHDLDLTAAEKTGKMDFVEIMNAEFLAGAIKLRAGACDQLVVEYRNLVKDPKAKRPAEHPACPNHCCDGALYAWRYCYPYLSRPLVERPRPGSQEAYDEEEARMKAAQLRRHEEPLVVEPLPGDAWDEPVVG